MEKQVSPLKIAVLVSGGGTNLQALMDTEKKWRQEGKALPYTVALVVSSSKNAYALERAAAAGVPSTVVSPYTTLGSEKAKTASRDEKRFAVSNGVLKLCQEHQIVLSIIPICVAEKRSFACIAAINLWKKPWIFAR